MNVDPAVLVPELLRAAGISPSEEEIAMMVAQFPGRAAAIESLYAVPEARYEEPGLVFHALL
jgi:hypothetical protein